MHGKKISVAFSASVDLADRSQLNRRRPRMRGVALISALIAAFTLPFAIAEAAPIMFAADLNAANEIQVPPVVSPATGHVTAVLDPTAQTLLLNVTFSGLTSPDIAAHIHCCIPQPGNTGVATTVPAFPNFPLGVTSGTYSQLLDLTSAGSYNPAFVSSHGMTVASAEAAFVAGLEGGQTYLNIHTTPFPSGEIRGILALVPAPSTLLLLGAGLAGFAITTGWRSRRN